MRHDGCEVNITIITVGFHLKPKDTSGSMCMLERGLYYTRAGIHRFLKLPLNFSNPYIAIMDAII